MKRRAVKGLTGSEIGRVIGAVLFEQNDEWQTSSRYMMVEAFAQIDKEEIDPIRECHELCVSGLAHAGFRYGHALKRSSNMIAN